MYLLKLHPKNAADSSVLIASVITSYFILLHPTAVLLMVS